MFADRASIKLEKLDVLYDALKAWCDIQDIRVKVIDTKRKIKLPRLSRNRKLL
jgi:hypothetical protein